MPTLPASWSAVHTQNLPPRDAVVVPIADLAVGDAVRSYFAARAPNGVWTHQRDAISAHAAGRNVCLATPTASGKTLVFHASALEHLAKDPAATILALYPMKALGNEQQARWEEALAAAGIAGAVARVDGSVHPSDRDARCRNARVIVATPDVLHTWLLPRLGSKSAPSATRFVRNLALVVVDEAHTYAGVFGSGAAFVFRRLQHALGLLGREPQFIAASATMADSKKHVEALLGRPFEVIGADRDGSPRQAVEVVMARPDAGIDFHSALSTLFSSLRDSGERFIGFFDNRKSCEQMAAILQRGQHTPDAGEEADELFGPSVLPFRAGYEDDHRRAIQERLTSGSLTGVLSTSAMELGLDIPNLHTVVLVGVPGSGTSLRQRMGRVGRSMPGRVIVVHSGSLGDDLAFAEPEALLERPLNDSTIHLENRRIQYIHAMALARIGGEHDAAAIAANKPAAQLDATSVTWPAGFLDLCRMERDGRVPTDLRDMKRDAGDSPASVFMVRDVEPQFEVFCKRGMMRTPLGTLSFSQVMREAYPGAAYYYMGRPYRVMFVDTRSRKIGVTPCAGITTQPMPVHSRLTPQRGSSEGTGYGELSVIESELQIWRAVRGFREKRGGGATQIAYPCTDPVRFEQPSFTRTIFTTGVCLAHPVLDRDGVDLDILASLLQESFRLVLPVERQDIDADSDVLRTAWASLEKGRKFLCLFDQAAGSLRLTARLRDPSVLREVLETLAKLATQRDTVPVGNDHRVVSPITKVAARLLRDALQSEPIALSNLDGDDSARIPVLLPQSHVRSSERPGEVFEIHAIFPHPVQGLSYRGMWIQADGTRMKGVVAIDTVEPANDGVVRGFYDPETGEQSVA